MWMDGYVGGGSGAGGGHERGARHAGRRGGQAEGQAENARFIRHCIRSLAFILYSIHDVFMERRVVGGIWR